MSRRIWNIKVNPTAMEGGRWIEMVQKRRGFLLLSSVPRECVKYTKPNCLREPRLLEAESRHCLKQSTMTSFGHVTAESNFRVTLKCF